MPDNSTETIALTGLGALGPGFSPARSLGPSAPSFGDGPRSYSASGPGWPLRDRTGSGDLDVRQDASHVIDVAVPWSGACTSWSHLVLLEVDKCHFAVVCPDEHLCFVDCEAGDAAMDDEAADLLVGGEIVQ